MAAPEGNQFYKIALANDNLNGRPAIFKSPEVVQQLFEGYIKHMEGEVIYKADFVKSGQDAGKIIKIPCRAPYTIEGFCLFCGMTSNNLNKLMNDEKNKDLIPILSYVKETIRNDQIKGGLVGTLNPMLVARIQGLKEQQEITGEIKNTVTSITFTQRTIEDTEFQEVNNLLDQE